jgi:hypothetical protein
MKRSFSLIAVMLSTVLSTVAWANDTPGTVPKTKVPPPKTTLPVNPTPTVNTSTAATSSASAQSVSAASSQAGAYGGYVGTVGNSLNVDYPGVAVAPDVISYPTAPCRVSVGASGGWFGGAIGFSGSTKDDECGLINLSVALHNLGNKPAAVQILCLSDDARMALEATGVKCLIKRPVQQEPVKP